MDGELLGQRILIVDDDDDTREIMAMVLVGAGADVHAARSVAEAYEAFLRVGPDVVVSDIGMPVEDGYSLARKLRALGPARGGDTPAIALTAFVRDVDRAAALEAGFTVHLPKPVTPDELIGTIVRLQAQCGQVGAR